MNSTAEIPPLWERLPSAFAYGLRSWPLLLSFLLALASALLLALDSRWWQIVIYAVMFKYAFAVLQHTAEGELDPPPLDWEVIGTGYEVTVKFYGILLLFVLLVFSATSKFGVPALVTLLLLGAFSLPAVTMVLAQTESLLSAINPVLVFATIGRIGWAYVVLLIFTALLSTGEAYMGDLVERASNPYLVIFGFTLVGSYFTFISFYMMGYVLLQSHERLGFDAPAALQPSAEQTRLTRFQEFMADGKTDAAIGELEFLLKETPRDLALHRRMHNLLLAGQRTEQLATHTQRVLPFLLTEGHAGLAAEFYTDSAQFSGDNGPRRSECYLDLAQALRLRGSSKEAVRLVNQFNRRFAQDDPNKPAFYLLVARTLSEDLNQDAKARRLLEVGLKIFPNHPERQEMVDYLRVLERVA